MPLMPQHMLEIFTKAPSCTFATLSQIGYSFHELYEELLLGASSVGVAGGMEDGAGLGNAPLVTDRVMRSNSAAASLLDMDLSATLMGVLPPEPGPVLRFSRLLKKFCSTPSLPPAPLALST